MRSGVFLRALRVGALSIAMVLAGCSEGGGPTASGGDAIVAGVLTADPSTPAAGAALAGMDDDDFSGAPLAGAFVRLVDPTGAVIFDSRTDGRGEFELTAPEGVYRLEVELANGETFTFEVSLDAGERLFVQARVRGGAVIDAEIFTDDDGDGVSDSGFSVRIRGREAGRPGSGDVDEEGPDDDELDDEDEDGDDDPPAALGDFVEGQRVFVKGEGTAVGFVAEEVHGNSGRADRFCRLSGFVTGVEHGAGGELTGIEIFGVTVNLSGAHVAGARGGRGPRSSIEAGVRVEIHAQLDEGSGELLALRLHARGGRGNDPERISGRLTDEPDAAARLLEVCGISVTVADGARLTNGDGRDDDDGDDDGDDDDGDDDEVSFAEFLAALAAGGFNNDARGTFDESSGTLRLEKLALSLDARSRIEIVADVTDANAGAGTFRLLGLPVVVDSNTDLRGLAAADLTNGRRVKAEVDLQGAVLVATRIQRTGEPRDRLRGGVLALVSGDLAADPNVSVDLGGGLSVAGDADSSTEFEVES